MPDAVQAATGRFERNPPQYYQMRIDREAPEVKRNPKNLELYDDIAVAYARLGHNDLAIDWIERKHLQMGDLSKAHSVGGKLDGFSEAAYRYYANAGTFWVHRWAQNGGKASEISQVARARDLIKRAIEVNPDAHFGREIVQLRVMEWLIDLKTHKRDQPTTLGEFLESSARSDAGSGPDSNMRFRGSLDKDIKGLIGLISLGAGWESPDMFEALDQCIANRAHNINKLGIFVSLRERELLGAGKKAFADDWEVPWERLQEYREGDKVVSEFKRLRAEADEWNRVRTDFMMARLRAGRHPDSDPHFWDGYVSKPAPQVEYGVLDRVTEWDILNAEIFGCCSLPIIAVVGFVWYQRRSIRKHLKKPQQWH